MRSVVTGTPLMVDVSMSSSAFPPAYAVQVESGVGAGEASSLPA